MALRTVEAAGRDLRAKRVTAVELVEECLRAIASADARLNAFILVMADDARRQAAEADKELSAGIDRGPLHGIPISVKDIFDISGTVTTAASRVREGIVATEDAPVIARLRKGGAVIVGKTNLHEFAFGTTNEDSAFGPAHHPLDESRSPGGSSGGSAVSVAAGMALATLGTDTGGSIRIPSALCGLVGVKPTCGELPTSGVIPLSRTLDHVGPLARSVADAHVLHAVLRGQTSRAPLSIRPVRSLRVGVLRPYFCDLLEEDVRNAFETTLNVLRAAGATVTEVSIPDTRLIAPAYLQIVFGDAAAYHGPALESMPERYTPNVRLRLEMARYALAEDYVRARACAEMLQRQVNEALSRVDALFLPTIPIVAPRLGQAFANIDGRQEPVRNVMLRLTQLFNLTGHPAVSIPMGAGRTGLPTGLQIVGRHRQTDTLLDIAASVERELVH